ncbi:MAG: DUF3592 domain-containing protein [Prosthecobacter sp.]
MQPALPWFLRKTKSWKGFSAGVAALFCLPFLVAGLFCLWSLSLQPTLNWARARSWQPTDAVMEAAQLKASGRRRTTYEVEVQFRYQYHGAEHTGTRHSFVSAATSVGVPGMRQVVESLPPGKKVTCWVNPGNPAESVLDRSLPAQVGFGLFLATPFITFGMAGMGYLALPLFRWRFRAKREAQLADLVAAGKLPQWVLLPFAQNPDAQENDVALVIATDERRNDVLGLLFFNLLWNGLIGAFVWADLVLIVHGGGGKALLLTLVLIPFVAVGLFLIWLLVEGWKALRRPQWVAALRPAPGFEGGEADFCWAWLGEERMPQAMIRVVAQAARWNKANDTPSRGARNKRRKKTAAPASLGEDKMELAAVEVSLLDASNEMRLTLPQVTPPSAESAQRSRWLPPVIGWAGWWQLEVAYRDGQSELSDLTQPEKLA